MLCYVFQTLASTLILKGLSGIIRISTSVTVMNKHCPLTYKSRLTRIFRGEEGDSYGAYERGQLGATETNQSNFVKRFDPKRADPFSSKQLTSNVLKGSGAAAASRAAFYGELKK